MAWDFYLAVRKNQPSRAITGPSVLFRPSRALGPITVTLSLHSRNHWGSSHLWFPGLSHLWSDLSRANHWWHPISGFMTLFLYFSLIYPFFCLILFFVACRITILFSTSTVPPAFRPINTLFCTNCSVHSFDHRCSLLLTFLPYLIICSTFSSLVQVSFYFHLPTIEDDTYH
jgi:hypothetical protein